MTYLTFVQSILDLPNMIFHEGNCFKQKGDCLQTACGESVNVHKYNASETVAMVIAISAFGTPI